MNPLKLTFEFTRSSREPFRLGEQEYLHRKETGRFEAASLNWGEALLSDLAELGKPEPAQGTVHRLGELLRGFLEPVGWESYEARIQEALRANQPVFLSFQFDADELYALPWELLTLRGSGQRLAELPGLLLRYEWPDTRTTPLDPDPPKAGRLLYAWSSAGGQVPSEKQRQALHQACGLGGVAFEPRRDVLEHASTRALAEALRAPEPVAILHLLCHGAQQGPDRLGLMLDASQPGGEPEFIDAQALASLLAPRARTLRLVVLSSCQSGATGAPGSTLPGVARALHQAGIQCVVASRLPLSVEGSVELTETLYGELLGTPCSLEQAFGLARGRLRGSPSRMDWASLQLYARAADGTDTRPLALRPYRGLLAFQPEHSRFFFGREPLREELRNRLDESHLTQRLQEASTQQRHRFQVVAGASGSGKSSLVLAGVVAHLDKLTWDVVVTRPGEGGGFAAAKPGVTSPAPGGALLSLWRALHHQWAPREAAGPVSALGLDDILEEAARMRRARPDRRLLLVVDQLEEVFTQVPSRAERQTYVGALWALCERRELGVIVLSTLRVDYFGRCGELAVDEEGKRLDAVVYSPEHRMFVTQLQGEQLQAIIEGPARKVGLRLDEGLVEVLRRDVGAEPGALPLLEYTLDQLWERREGNRLTHQAYEELGGVAGALTGAANRLLATFSPEESKVARDLLVELVDFTSDASPNTRRRGWLAQLRPSGGTEQVLFDRVLARLVGSRLLVKGGGDGASASEEAIWIEVAHESLIRRWETLTEWCRADQKAAQERRELRGLAERWRAHLGAPDKGKSFLLAGYRLEAARHLQREHGGQLAPDIHQFIDESWRRARARSRAARLRISSVLTASVLVALVMSFLAYKAREAKRAEEAARKRAEKAAQIANDLSRLSVAHRKLKTDPTTSLLFLRDVEEPGDHMTWQSDVRNVLDEPLSQAVLKGHTDEILWVDFSPTGGQVATGSRDGTARVWDLDRSKDQTFSLKEPVTRVAFSPDGNWLVASTERNALVSSLKGKTTPEPFQKLRAMAFSPAGDWVVGATLDGAVKLWRGIESSEPPHVLQKEGHGTVMQVAFDPKGRHVLAVSQHSVRVWRVSGQERPLELPTGGFTSASFRTAGFTSAALSPDGEYLAVGGSDKRAKVLRVRDGKPLWQDCRDKVLRAEFSPDGERVLLVFEEFVAQVRKLKDASCAGTTFSGHTTAINRATFSPNGDWVLTVSHDATARLWPVVCDTRSPAPVQVMRGHRIGVTWAAFSQDGNRVVTGGKDRTARVWDLAKKERRFSTSFPHLSEVWSAAVSPDQQYIASASNDGTVRLWAPSGHLLAKLEGHKGVVRALAFSPDNQWLVTGGWDGTLRLWSLSGLRSTPLQDTVLTETDKFSTNQVILDAVAFSPARAVRRVAAGGSDGRVYFWRLEDSGARTRLVSEALPETVKHDDYILSVAFSSTGDSLITASQDRLAKVWNVSSGKLMRSLKGHENWVRSATFSPDDSFALTASQDGSARVWDLRQEEPHGIRFNHEFALRGASFSPDGKHFATASVGGLVRLWPWKGKEEEKPRPFLVLTGHEDEVTSVVYMGEDKLVTSSIDTQVRLWKHVDGESSADLRKELQEELRKATSLCLGKEEWEHHTRGHIPERSQQRFKECEQGRTQKVESLPVAATKGGG